MSLFLCRKRTEHTISILSRYQTQRHGILSFSRKPIGSWVEIHISVDDLVFEHMYQLDSFDIFDVLSSAREISLHCYFASFDTPTDIHSLQEYNLPRNVECLFSTQILVSPDLTNENLTTKLAMEKGSSINNTTLAILFQDILDSCETFRGQYGFVIPFVVLKSVQDQPESNLNRSCNLTRNSKSQKGIKLTTGNLRTKDIGEDTISPCYYTLNCFNYTAGVWKIRTKPLAIATQELKTSQFSLSSNFSESA